MFNDLSSPLALLATRRSGRPRDLVAPGPDAAQLRAILEIATRSPDHGKLHPWRFVHIPRARRGDFADLLDAAYRADHPDPGRLELEANARFAHQAPELIVALSSPTEGIKIPLWEQELSCGAACMNLLLAAFGAPPERIAGFIFLGTPGVALEERPRPDYEEVVSEWTGDRPIQFSA